ncbi:Uncharacterised protein [Acinetobacter baumannii]|nr:Uncharacterised protein [Acinetobacter baumannii]
MKPDELDLQGHQLCIVVLRLSRILQANIHKYVVDSCELLPNELHDQIDVNLIHLLKL